MNYLATSQHTTLIWLWFTFYVVSIVLVLPKPNLFKILVARSEQLETQTQELNLTPRILLRAFLLIPLLFLVHNLV